MLHHNHHLESLRVRPFRDRREGGRLLARALAPYARGDTLVLALPRGGVPVGYEVARALGAPLDVLLVRKLGLPGHPELAMGAIASNGVVVRNEAVIEAFLVPQHVLEEVERSERAELERRERAYRGDCPAPRLWGRTLVLVDDGLATGSTMRAAVTALSSVGPSRVIVATPVASAEACWELGPEPAAIVCANAPRPFYSVGAWYEDFTQTSDDDVRFLLAAADVRQAGEN